MGGREFSRGRGGPSGGPVVTGRGRGPVEELRPNWKSEEGLGKELVGPREGVGGQKSILFPNDFRKENVEREKAIAHSSFGEEATSSRGRGKPSGPVWERTGIVTGGP